MCHFLLGHFYQVSFSTFERDWLDVTFTAFTLSFYMFFVLLSFPLSASQSCPFS
jgi:hypothetical protein